MCTCSCVSFPMQAWAWLTGGRWRRGQGILLPELTASRPQAWAGQGKILTMILVNMNAQRVEQSSACLHAQTVWTALQHATHRPLRATELKSSSHSHCGWAAQGGRRDVDTRSAALATAQHQRHARRDEGHGGGEVKPVASAADAAFAGQARLSSQPASQGVVVQGGSDVLQHGLVFIQAFGEGLW